MNVNNHGAPSFSLAQAFTPGNRESDHYSQPPSGGFVSKQNRQAPWKGATHRGCSSNPGVNAWAKEKAPGPMSRYEIS